MAEKGQNSQNFTPTPPGFTPLPPDFTPTPPGFMRQTLGFKPPYVVNYMWNSAVSSHFVQTVLRKPLKL
jgi:hypothetical protein